MRTAEESFLPRLSFELINFNTKGRWKKIDGAFNMPLPPAPVVMRRENTTTAINAVHEKYLFLLIS